MGSVGKGFSSIMTFGLGGKLLSDQKKKMQKAQSDIDASLRQTNANTVDAEAGTKPVEEQQKDIKKRRVNLFKTQGGIKGEELSPNSISKRQTLLGN
jgi:hypothetical protein